MCQAGREYDTATSCTDIQRAKRIGHVVRMASRWVPWNAVCLPQAVAAKSMLARRRVPATLYVGLRRAGALSAALNINSIELHAWLRVDDKIITGGEVSRDFQALISYS